jgi:FtsP/CotA-like multicopper oxidase with cupredoxin domain
MRTKGPDGAPRTLRTSILRACGVIAALAIATPGNAGPGWGDTTNPSPDPTISKVDTAGNMKVRTYYANSPQGMQLDALDPLNLTPTRDTGTALRKFVDPLPQFGTDIPFASPDKTTYPGSDYYEIAVVEYTQKMHSDLAKATTLRGYVQIDPVATDAAANLTGNGGVHPGATAIPLFQLDGVTPVMISRPDGKGGFVQVQAYAAAKPTYLGPTVVATRGTPTRIKFYNGLPSGRAYTDGNGVVHRQGDLFIPVDHTLMGAGDGQTQAGTKNLLCGDTLVGPNNTPDPTLSSCLADPLTGTPQGYVQVPAFEIYTENREELHLHGGDNPWVSDGTPHQWITPAADELTLGENYRRGVLALNVPDMPEAGPGAVTYYWPNGQSGRLMFYHDHATGLTRLNVYAGTAAGYLLVDPAQSAIDAAYGVGIPLVIQDKTFVPKDILTQDAKWDTQHWGQEGDLWFPHVYETNQDPLSADATNPVGRWDGASFFWPVFPQSYQTPTGEYGNVTTTPEAFMDTPVVNGMAYPTLTVDPILYRFRILNAANDRMLNLSLFVADPTVSVTTGAAFPNTEVKMVPFISPNGPTSVTYTCPDGVTAGQTVGTVNANGTITKAGWTESGTNSAGVVLYPNSFPCAGGLLGTGWGQADNRPGGVPDPATAGPSMVRIGSEGGLLPQAADTPPTAVNYEYNKRSVTVLNVLERALWLGPAERADVLVDFSAFAGKTLILYNDSSAPVPAGDPRIDYYTGDGDQTGAGGAPNTVAGYGPNTRTIMQINVTNNTPATPVAPIDLTALNSTLATTFLATQAKPIVPTTDYAPLVAAGAGFTATSPYEHIYTGAIYLNKYNALQIPAGDVTESFYYTPADTLTCNSQATCAAKLKALRQGANGGLKLSSAGLAINAYVESKAIQELFEPDYGRMNATLGVELPFTNVNIQTTIPLAYVDPATETINPGEVQFWKITHNGVDSHPVHFHFINVQVINRVGWDGTIKAPAADEIGWKETVKMHPLEDIIVAVRAKTAPPTPFGMPHSYRQPAPNQLATDNHGITQIDPATGNAPATPFTNSPVDYGSEYVWHCHILGHEENDFMRPFIFRAQETAAPPFTATPTAAAATAPALGIQVSWTDPTPVPATLTAYDPVLATSGFLGNPANEIGFRIERAPASTDASNVTTITGPFAPVAGGLHVLNAITGQVNAPANAQSYLDPVGSGTALPTPAAPTVSSQTASSVTLALPALPTGVGSFTLYRDGVVLAAGLTGATYVDSTVVAGGSYSYTLMSVAPGGAPSQYVYRVVAVTAAGETTSATSNPVDANGLGNVSTLSQPLAVVMIPAALAGVTVTNPTVGSLQVNWSAAPASQQVTGYVVSMDGAPGLAAASPDVVGGLAANTSHAFRVAAVNAAGTGAYSAPVSGLTLPAAATGLAASGITAGGVNLAWTAPANAAGVSYAVQSAPAAGTVAVNGTTASVGGLAPNTSYSFAVVTSNASGAGAASNTVSVLTLPVPPTGLTATPVSSTSVTLAWAASAGGAATYTVQYSANNGASWTSLAPVTPAGTTVSGLTPATTYLFQVVANNATGSSTPSGQVSATTPAATVAPGVPACCTASSPTATSVVINWVAPATGPATSYNVQRATNATFTRGLQTVLNVTATSVPFTGLNSNVVYYFRVQAVNSVGTSAYSAAFTFQPPAAPPAPAAPTAAVSAVSTNPPTVTLTFAAPATGVTYTVYQQSRTGGGLPWGTAVAVATGVTGTGWTSGPLVPMQYRYYLVAVNAAGSSANGGNSNTVTAQQLANAPTGLAATNVTPVTTGFGSRSVNLGWALGAANGSTVTAIRVVRANGTSLAGTLSTTNLAATATAYTVTGLARNATYTFQVQAVTSGGVNGSTTVTITTLP